MKNQEILKKYEELLASKLACEPKDILFTIDGLELSSRWTQKSDKDIKSRFHIGKYEVFRCKKLVASWMLYQMQHCCGVMVSCQARVEEGVRNRGIGTLLNSLRQEIGRGLGYSTMLCTDIEKNIHQRQLLATQGFKDIYNFVNKRTNNRVYMSIVNL